MGVVIETCTKYPGGPTRMTGTDMTPHASRVVILIVFARKCRVGFRHFRPNTGHFRHFRPNTGCFRPTIWRRVRFKTLLQCRPARQ
jgi:hypothetical protein